MKLVKLGSTGRFVVLLQQILNLKDDGDFGGKTEAAVRKFQSDRGLIDDGVVGPTTWKFLYLYQDSKQSTYYVSNEEIARIFRNLSDDKIRSLVTSLNKCMNKYLINTKVRVAHFLSQIGHESGEFIYKEEIASGKAYDTGRLAKALGNTPEADGDGQLYKGRGYIQLTGRANYEEYSDFTGYDFVSNPEKLASDELYAIDVAGWFWAKRGINIIADQGDIRSVTKYVNGGTNGIDHRIEIFNRANRELHE